MRQEDEDDFELELDDKLPTEMRQTMQPGPLGEPQHEAPTGVPVMMAHEDSTGVAGMPAAPPLFSVILSYTMMQSILRHSSVCPHAPLTAEAVGRRGHI
jgi:hypothetical protein